MNDLELRLFINEKLCDLADALIHYYDCCEMRGSKCLVGDPNPCCKATRFGKNGCPFMKEGKCGFRNIECKLWFCETALKQMGPEAVQAFQILEQLAKLYGLTKSPLLGEPYEGADKPINS